MNFKIIKKGHGICTSCAVLLDGIEIGRFISSFEAKRNISDCFGVEI